MANWGEWIEYAMITSLIALITTVFVYFITERKQFLICLNMMIKRKVKR